MEKIIICFLTLRLNDMFYNFCKTLKMKHMKYIYV